MSYQSIIQDPLYLNEPLDGPIWVIDDEEIRYSIAFSLKPKYNVDGVFSTAADFLASIGDDIKKPGVILCDLYLDDKMSGTDLQAYLAQEESPISVVFLSGPTEVRTAVNAMVDGAVNFLEKPVDPIDLMDAVEDALHASWRSYQKNCIMDAIFNLSARERDVLKYIFQGKTSNEAAEELFLSHRTIEVHRHNIGRKLGSGAPIRLLYEMILACNDGLDMSSRFASRRRFFDPESAAEQDQDE